MSRKSRPVTESLSRRAPALDFPLTVCHPQTCLGVSTGYNHPALAVRARKFNTVSMVKTDPHPLVEESIEVMSQTVANTTGQVYVVDYQIRIGGDTGKNVGPLFLRKRTRFVRPPILVCDCRPCFYRPSGQNRTGSKIGFVLLKKGGLPPM
jgi:hypothetical protein